MARFQSSDNPASAARPAAFPEVTPIQMVTPSWPARCGPYPVRFLPSWPYSAPPESVRWLGLSGSGRGRFVPPFPPPRGHPVPLRPSRPASCAPVSVSSDSFRYDSLAPCRAVGPYCASKFPPAGYPGPGLPLTVRPPPMRPLRHCGLQPPDVVRHLPHCRLFPLIDAAVRPDRSRPIRPLSRPSRLDTSDPSRLDTSDPSRLRAGPPAVRLVSSRAPRLDPSESYFRSARCNGSGPIGPAPSAGLRPGRLVVWCARAP